MLQKNRPLVKKFSFSFSYFHIFLNSFPVKIFYSGKNSSCDTNFIWKFNRKWWNLILKSISVRKSCNFVAIFLLKSSYWKIRRIRLKIRFFRVPIARLIHVEIISTRFSYVIMFFFKSQFYTQDSMFYIVTSRSKNLTPKNVLKSCDWGFSRRPHFACP